MFDKIKSLAAKAWAALTHDVVTALGLLAIAAPELVGAFDGSEVVQGCGYVATGFRVLKIIAIVAPILKSRLGGA